MVPRALGRDFVTKHASLMSGRLWATVGRLWADRQVLDESWRLEPGTQGSWGSS